MLPLGTPMSFLHGVANFSVASKFLPVCLCILQFVIEIKGDNFRVLVVALGFWSCLGIMIEQNKWVRVIHMA